jgi:hypothetical protein
MYELEENFDCILNGPWIEFVFGYHWGILEDFKAKHGLYMKLFTQKKNIWQVCVKFIDRSLRYSFMKKEENKSTNFGLCNLYICCIHTMNTSMYKSSP